jgi:predicted RNA-binding protein with PUA-like domain
MEIVGIAEVVKEHYQDPTTDLTAWIAVDLKPKVKLKKPVTLAEIKGDKILANMQIVKQFRLSVSAVTEVEFKHILTISDTVIK